MDGLGIKNINKRLRITNYLTVAQLFLRQNFLLENPLTFDDIKPRLLGHWGTCPGINLAYSGFRECFKNDQNFTFVVGPGHGFPALQANLFLDGELAKYDQKTTRDKAGIEYICRNFSWPDGFPSHASPMTPHVICEGGELGYALATSYGYVLGHPEKTVAVLIGDGEFETATTLASLNLNKIISGPANGKVIPILHLNGYKISGPTIVGRKSERELFELLRGFGFTPILIAGDDEVESFSLDLLLEEFSKALKEIADLAHPFLILKTDKGITGPTELDGVKIAGNYKSHQIPLPNAKTDEKELKILENWLKSYRFNELFNTEEGFKI